MSKATDLCNMSKIDVLDASKSEDILSSPNTSTIKDLEDFIDKSFYNALAPSASAQPMDMSTPVQRGPEVDWSKLGAQFLSFKGNVEAQLQVLSCKLSEQNNIINASKQEICKLNGENLHLKPRISELEAKLLLVNTSNVTSGLDVCGERFNGNTILNKNADACVTAIGCLPETSAYVDDTLTSVSQLCVETSIEDYDKETPSLTDDNVVNLNSSMKSRRQVFRLPKPAMDNSGENERNKTAGVVLPNCTENSQPNLTSLEQDSKILQTSTKSATTHPKPQVPEWLSHLPLIETPGDDHSNDVVLAT